jgi:hypothetical protein
VVYDDCSEELSELRFAVGIGAIVVFAIYYDLYHLAKEPKL